VKIFIQSFFVSFLFMTLAIPALASVDINTPINGSQVDSPFKVSADAATCSSQSVSTMGYSLDNSPDTTMVSGESVDASVSASAGAHTLHVKAWNGSGAVCVADVGITVVSSPGDKAIPSNAVSVSNIQALGNWDAANDSGGEGSSSGSTSLVNSPSMDGTAREFVTHYKNNGDERYSISFGDDESATNFFYDTWIYLTSSSQSIGNVEMDFNQVMSNGQTVIFGFQCDGWNGTWDYTANLGSPDHPKDSWLHSGASCNPRSWSINTRHHVQVSYSRNDSGVVTYQYVVLDGTRQNINATALSAFALGWGPTLLTNFQIDGLGSSGSNTVFMDDLTIYRW
jgi:hypothetical protein